MKVNEASEEKEVIGNYPLFDWFERIMNYKL